MSSNLHADAVLYCEVSQRNPKLVTKMFNKATRKKLVAFLKDHEAPKLKDLVDDNTFKKRKRKVSTSGGEPPLKKIAAKESSSYSSVDGAVKKTGVQKPVVAAAKKAATPTQKKTASSSSSSDSSSGSDSDAPSKKLTPAKKPAQTPAAKVQNKAAPKATPNEKKPAAKPTPAKETPKAAPAKKAASSSDDSSDDEEKPASSDAPPKKLTPAKKPAQTPAQKKAASSSDSDDDSSDAYKNKKTPAAKVQTKAAPKKKATPQVVKQVSKKESSSGSSDSDDNKKKPVAVPAKATPKAAVTKKADSSSDDSSDDEKKPAAKPTPAKATPKAAPAKKAESSSDDSSDNEKKPASKQTPAKATPKAAPKKPETSDSDSNSADSGDGKAKKLDTVKATLKVVKQVSKKESSSGSSDSDDNKKKPVAVPAKATPKAAPTKNAESSSDDSSNDAKKAVSKPAPVKATPKAVAKKADSSSDDSSEDEKKPAAKATPAKTIHKAAVGKKTGSSSDDSSDDEKKKTAAKPTPSKATPKAAPAKKAESSSDDSSDDEKKKTAAKPTPSKATPKAAPAKKAESSSDDSSEDEKKPAAKPTPAKATPKAAPTKKAASSSDDSSDDEKKPASKPTPAKATPKAVTKKADSSSDDSSDDEKKPAAKPTPGKATLKAAPTKKAAASSDDSSNDEKKPAGRKRKASTSGGEPPLKKIAAKESSSDSSVDGAVKKTGVQKPVAAAAKKAATPTQKKTASSSSGSDSNAQSKKLTPAKKPAQTPAQKNAVINKKTPAAKVQTKAALKKKATPKVVKQVSKKESSSGSKPTPAKATPKAVPAKKAESPSDDNSPDDEKKPAAKPTPVNESVNQFFESRERRKKDDLKVRKDRSPTPESVIASRDAEWRERLRLKQERESSRKTDEEQHNAWSLQSLSGHETYNRFRQSVDGVLEQAESLDTELTMPKKKKKKSDESMSKGSAEVDESEEEEENDEIDSDLRIDLPVLEELRRGSTRLREKSVLQALGADRLTKLVAMLDRNIRDTISADNTRLLVPCSEDADIGDLSEKDLCEERLKRASDAAVIALNIMSSHEMLKEVIIEDVIDRCIDLTRLLLIHLIYPASDSIYRVNTEETKRRKEIGICTRDKFTEYVYERVTEIVGLLAVLAKSDSMTDTSVHNIASVALTPFFVANVGSLQVSAMLLSANIFSRAEDSLRFSMITDFLSSLHRAPQYTQKNTNNGYTLPDGSWISMTTALFITLVQATIKVPKHKKNVDEEETAKRAKKDEGLVKEAFLQASKVTNAFLNEFLAKCSQKGSKMDGEEDYRILFSNFLQELLVALNSPEWPAAEMILTALGSVLVKNFRAKSTEMTLRQASLNYLGNITAKLRKDMKDAIVGEKRLDEIVKKAFYLMDDKGYDRYEAVDISELTQNDKLKILEGALIDYLVISNPSDIVVYACTYYVGEWYKETVEDMESAKSKHKNMMETSETEKDRRNAEKKYEKMKKRGADMKEFLSKLLDKKEIKRRLEKTSKVKMVDSDALWAVKYLAQNREFSHSFETYLKHIVFGTSTETIVALRSKALKCISSIIEVDHAVLILEDVQQAVHSRMVDSHTQVRESAVELIGRFVLYDEEYVRKYYPQIARRILDIGVAVRKRVIRIMREICERFPTFEMIPDMLARMVRRYSDEDEDGVKKLVRYTFTTLWFQPIDTRVNPNGVATKVATMCSVYQHCIKDNMNDYLEQLIRDIVTTGTEASMSIAVKQIVDSLVDHILNLELRKSENGVLENEKEEEYMAYISMLAVFSRVKPDLLTVHVEVLLPYLTFTGSRTNTENQVTKEVIGMLERVIPLIPFPSNEVLDSIDDNLYKVILLNGMNMIVTAVSCIASIYKKFHRGAKKCIEAFGKFIKTMEIAKQSLEHGNAHFEDKMIPIFSRAIFCLGVLSQYFPFEKFVALYDNPVDKTSVEKLKDRVFVVLEFFIRFNKGGIRQVALTALGHFCAQHSEYLTKKSLTKICLQILNAQDVPQQQRVTVLRNLEMFLQWEERKMAASHEKWEEGKDAQNLKVMKLSGSGLGSSVIQNYWKAVLESYMAPDVQLRKASVQVVWLTLNQGLVTPGASIPTLIAMSTDPVKQIRNRIDNLLDDINSTYVGMLKAGAMRGIRLAFKLHQTLHAHSPHKLVRGFRFSDYKNSMKHRDDTLPEKTHDASAVLSGLYQSLRTNRQHRRSFQQSIVKLFNDIDSEGMSQLAECIFIADNLAMFPYQTIDEVLFVCRVCEQNITTLGGDVCSEYDSLLKTNKTADEDTAFADLPLKLKQHENIGAFKNLYYKSQIPSLLLYVRKFLMQLYGFSDQHLAEYLPSESTKTNDKAVTRRNIAMFNPATVIEALTVSFDSDSKDQYDFLADNINTFRTMLYATERSDAVENDANVTTINQGDDYDEEEKDNSSSTSAHVPVEP